MKRRARTGEYVLIRRRDLDRIGQTLRQIVKSIRRRGLVDVAPSARSRTSARKPPRRSR